MTTVLARPLQMIRGYKSEAVTQKLLHFKIEERLPPLHRFGHSVSLGPLRVCRPEARPQSLLFHRLGL